MKINGKNWIKGLLCLLASFEWLLGVESASTRLYCGGEEPRIYRESLSRLGEDDVGPMT